MYGWEKVYWLFYCVPCVLTFKIYIWSKKGWIKRTLHSKKAKKMQISTLFRKNLPAVSRIRLSHMQQNPTLLRKILAPANAKFDQFKSLFAFFKLILFLEPRSFGRCWGMPWSIRIWNKIDFARHVEFRPYWENGRNLQLTAESSRYLMWLKSLCSWIKARQRWIKARQSTVMLIQIK